MKDTVSAYSGITENEEKLFSQINGAKNNGYEPVSHEDKKKQKKAKKKFWLEAVSFIAGGILAVVTFIAVEKLTITFFPDSSYRLLGIEKCPKSSFLLLLSSYRYTIIYIAEKLFIKKEYASERDRRAEKKTSAILLAVCCAVIILCTGYNYLFEICAVAVHDNGIYAGTQVKNEILPFGSDRVEFFLIEGYTDPETGIYYDGYEDKELYIVVDKRLEDYIISFSEDPEETVAFLKEKGFEIISVKDYEAFSHTYTYSQ